MDILIDALIPYIVPGIILVVGYFYNLIVVHIPAEVRRYTNPLANAAAAFVEQKYKDKSNEEKIVIALETAKFLFRRLRLPAPDDVTLVKLIEAAVNALDKKPRPGT